MPKVQYRSASRGPDPTGE